VSEPPARVRSDVAAVLVTYLVLGAGAGVLWWLLVEPAVYTKTESGGAMGDVELGRWFNVDGWFAVLALVLGFGSGLALSWWRSRDPWLTTALILAGSAGAAAVTAVVGRLLGPPDPGQVLASAAEGTEAAIRLVVSAEVVYLMWPLGALLGALMVLWSSPGAPTLDQAPEPGPGTAHDPAHDRTRDGAHLAHEAHDGAHDRAHDLGRPRPLSDPDDPERAWR
jgi:hypothetical protein